MCSKDLFIVNSNGVLYFNSEFQLGDNLPITHCAIPTNAVAIKDDTLFNSLNIYSKDTKYYDYFFQDLKLTFPNTVKTIGKRAFRGLTTISSITFSKGYTVDNPLRICQGAFSVSDYPGSPSNELNDVTLPEYTFIHIGDPRNNSDHPPFWHTPWSSKTKEYSFKTNSIIIISNSGDCSINELFPNLETVYLEDMDTIPDCYFKDCCYLKKIVGIEKVKVIGKETFENCRSLESLTLTSVTEIGSNAFKGCSGLTRVELPNVKTICSHAFKGCSGLTRVELPNVQTICRNAFENCYSLTVTHLSNVLEVMQEEVFKNCKSLLRLDIPDTICSIGQGAFTGCSSLQIINISDRLKSRIIKAEQFDSRTQMNTVCCTKTITQYSIWKINSRHK